MNANSIIILNGTLPLSKTRELQRDLWEKDILQAVLEHKWDNIHQFLDEADCIDEDNWTTLHWVCREHHTPSEAITLLLNAYPQAATHHDVNGCIPLHIALEYGKPLNFIRLLVESCPNTLQMVDVNGKTPLHTACTKANNAPLDVIEFLVNNCPEAALRKDCNGRTPLTEVICDELDDEVIEVLLRHCTDCASVNNEKPNCTPLHLAVIYSRSIKVMSNLIQCQPKLISSFNLKQETAEDLFYNKWDCQVSKFLDSLPSSASPSSIWNNKTMSDFPLQYVHDVTCFFLNRNITPMKDKTLHSAIQSQKCPWSFCQLFLHLYPHQFAQSNSQGSLTIELVSSSSKRKFYQQQKIRKRKIIDQIKECYGSSSPQQKAIMALYLINNKVQSEDVNKMNFLYLSLRDNPAICNGKRRKLA